MLSSQRVVVCASAGTFSPALIHAGATLAEQLRATWYVVYVEPAKSMWARDRAAEAESLRRTIDQATVLGGIVVRVMAPSFREGLAAFAAREGVTHVVVGNGRDASARPIYPTPEAAFAWATGVTVVLVPDAPSALDEDQRAMRRNRE